MVKVKLSFPLPPAAKLEALEKNQAAISTPTPQALGDRGGQHVTQPSQGRGGEMLLPSPHGFGHQPRAKMPAASCVNLVLLSF